MVRRKYFGIALVLALMIGCASAPSDAKEQKIATRIYGTITYLQRIMLPESAWAEVRLLRQVGPSSWQESSVLVIEKLVGPPIPYELILRQPLNPSNNYRLVVTIYLDDQPWSSNEFAPYLLDVFQERHDIVLPRAN